jgi:TolB protein
MKKIYFLLFLFIYSVAPGHCQESLEVTIYGPGQNTLNFIQAEPFGLAGPGTTPEFAGDFDELVQQNLNLVPFLSLMNGGDVLGGAKLEGVTAENIDFKRFHLSRADLIMTTAWKAEEAGTSRLECRVYEVFSGRLLAGKAYGGLKKDMLPRVADAFCSKLMEAMTGKGGFFTSNLAFTRRHSPTHREIWTVKPQGRNLKRVTFFNGQCVSPTWSLDGRYMAFSHHSSHSHNLGVLDTNSGQVFQVKPPGLTVSGMSFMPNGRLALGLSRGNMEIYQLTTNLRKIAKTLESNWAIDVSPVFDERGEVMVFVSDRQGSPQIYRKYLGNGTVDRLTYEGNYNTSPTLSSDGRLVAFSRLTPDGHRIFVHDTETGFERQVSFGPGNDEEPAFAPGDYFIAFASDRGGKYHLYLSTVVGGRAKRIPTGEEEATHPAFQRLKD